MAVCSEVVLEALWVGIRLALIGVDVFLIHRHKIIAGLHPVVISADVQHPCQAVFIFRSLLGAGLGLDGRITRVSLLSRLMANFIALFLISLASLDFCCWANFNTLAHSFSFFSGSKANRTNLFRPLSPVS